MRRASHNANEKNRDWLFIFLPLKLEIEQMNKVPDKIKIPYLLVEIFERPLNIPKRLSIENIGILYNYGPGVRDTNAQRLLVQSENTRTFVRTSIYRLVALQIILVCLKRQIKIRTEPHPFAWLEV